MRTPRFRKLTSFAVVTALAVLVAACGGDGDPTATQPAPTATQPEPTAPAVASGPQTAEILPSADATLYESEDGSLANGAGEWIFAGTTRIGAIRRGLILFDVAAQIPAGATITEASLTMRVTQTTAGPVEVGLHRVTTAWAEGLTDAFANEGSGEVAEPGDATWLHTGVGDALWASPGGDFDPTPVVAANVDAERELYTWGPSAALTAAVQGWVDDPAANLGWAVIGVETEPRTAKRFESRQNIEGFPEPVFPALSVTFE